MLKWPCRAFKPRLLPGCGYMHAREVKFRGRSHPAKLLAKRKPPTDRMDEKCQTTSQSCDNRVHPVSQYAGTLWETSCGCVLYSSSGRLAITVLRHNRDILVAQRASFRQGAPEKTNAWRFCSLTAGIREHSSLSLCNKRQHSSRGCALR